MTRSSAFSTTNCSSTPENYKPFEFSPTEDRKTTRVFDEVMGDKLRAAFPDLKIKYAAWDMPIRYTDLQAAGVVPDIVIDNPRHRIDRDLEPLGCVTGYQDTEYRDIPTYMVFRQHVLKDGMTVDSAMIVAEQEDFPAHIASRAEAGFDY